ncbi:MAG: ankyrin repeat domain-containing protein [Methylomarinum sp.]|nr:ankyrin repeat domain-containing protein [Methylomarinum sp.]
MRIKSLFLLLLISISPSALCTDIDSLFAAAILGKTERIKFLLASGVDVNGKTATGRTAMMAASFNGNIRVARVLLAYGADVNLIDNLGSSALMDAVIFGNGELVELLITSGADVKVEDNQKTSVLEKAKRTKSTTIIKILEAAIKNHKQPEPETEAIEAAATSPVEDNLPKDK